MSAEVKQPKLKILIPLALSLALKEKREALNFHLKKKCNKLEYKNGSYTATQKNNASELRVRSVDSSGESVPPGVYRDILCRV